jgi:hypothetical protein
MLDDRECIDLCMIMNNLLWGSDELCQSYQTQQVVQADVSGGIHVILVSSLLMDTIPI